jgi:hypothetical protein
MGMRNLTAEERKAYGLPPLPEDEQARRDAANQSEALKAAEEGRLEAGTDANGREVNRVIPPDPNKGQSGPSAADVQRYVGIVQNAAGSVPGQPGQPGLQLPAGAFGVGATPGTQTSNRPDWRLFTDPAGEANRQMLGQALGARQAMPTQSMTGAKLNTELFSQDRAAAAGARAGQMGLADAIAARARGEGGSLAQLQFQQATDSSLSSALALARSGRGNSTLNMKAALGQQGTMIQNAANQSSQLRLQEQAQAQEQLGNVLGQVRAGDMNSQQLALGAASTQAGLDQDASKTNLGASLQQQAQVDSMTQFYVSAGLTMDQARAQAMQEYEKLRILSYNQQRATELAEQSAQRQHDAQVFGTAANVFGTAFGSTMQFMGGK